MSLRFLLDPFRRRRVARMLLALDDAASSSTALVVTLRPDPPALAGRVAPGTSER